MFKSIFHIGRYLKFKGPPVSLKTIFNLSKSLNQYIYEILTSSFFVLLSLQVSFDEPRRTVDSVICAFKVKPFILKLLISSAW